MGDWQNKQRVQRYTFPAIKEVNHRDTMYSMVTAVNHTVLYSLKLLREHLNSSQHKKKIRMYGDGY